MNPKQLHCFITAAQEGSFSKAAKKLYLSQQALSKTIDKLEEELDVPLFIRGVAGLQLTRYGEALRQSAFPYLQMHDNIIADLQAMKDSLP